MHPVDARGGGGRTAQEDVLHAARLPTFEARRTGVKKDVCWFHMGALDGDIMVIMLDPGSCKERTFFCCVCAMCFWRGCEANARKTGGGIIPSTGIQQFLGSSDGWLC